MWSHINKAAFVTIPQDKIYEIENPHPLYFSRYGFAFYFIFTYPTSPVGKFGTQNTVPYCQKYTPTFHGENFKGRRVLYFGHPVYKISRVFMLLIQIFKYFKFLYIKYIL